MPSPLLEGAAARVGLALAASAILWALFAWAVA